MRREAMRFWGAAVLAAGGWAVLASFILPYEALGLTTGAERSRAWLLTLWTSGVMAICFGAAGIIGYGSPLGFKEVSEAGSVMEAIRARRQSQQHGGSFYQNFAWWLIVTGLLLIVIYFLAWGFSYA